MPRARKTDVPLAPRMVLRFSAPARVETVTSETVTLSGPEGPEAVTVTVEFGSAEMPTPGCVVMTIWDVEPL